VDHTIGQQYPREFTAVLPDKDLAEGKMRRVEWNGNRILLARRDERIYAIAEVCSHLGGPLAEGDFEGCTVRCPWHGSRFSLEDGHVIDGPSTHTQPCLDVRVSNGQIEVKTISGR
jgi:nitrite reductase/ring-hydroxylating ferredoxin subunit